MHPADRAKKITGRGGHNKTIVMGIKQRGGATRTQIIASTKKETFEGEVIKHVEPGSSAYTDTHGGYRFLSGLGYDHEAVDHMERYVDGKTHTNGLENF